MKNKPLLILISTISVLVIALALFIGISLSVSPDISQDFSDEKSQNNSSNTNVQSENQKIVTDKVFANNSSKNNKQKEASSKYNGQIFSSKSESQESKTSSANSAVTHYSKPSIPSTTNSIDIEELNKRLFIQLYEIYESEYLSQISQKLSTAETELQTWKDKAANNYSSYQIELEKLPEKYAALGLLNSGAYKRAVDDLEAEYNRTSKECTKNIDKLQEQIQELTAAQNSPDVSAILSALANNNSMTYDQAVEKYNKYIK